MLHRFISAQLRIRRAISDLEILAEDFDLVKSTILELDEPMAACFEVHRARFSIQDALVTIAPFLQPHDVLLQIWLDGKEILLEKHLEADISLRRAVTLQH